MIEFTIITNSECNPNNYGTGSVSKMIALEASSVSAGVVRDSKLKIFPPFKCGEVCKSGCVKDLILEELKRRRENTKGRHRHTLTVRIDEGLSCYKDFSAQTIEGYITSLTK